jgi:predicted NBD/HSP70 family sugar kinase
MSKPTASLTLARLLEAGVVNEVGRSSGRKGPAAVLYGLNDRAGAVLAVDLSRTRMRVAVADLVGQVRARTEESTRRRSASSVIEQLGRLARQTAREAGTPWRSITCCVMGTPGVVSSDTGALRWADSLPGWNRPGTIDTLRRTLGTRVVVDNDVDLAAIAEQRSGVAAGIRDFVFVWVGAGIGLGLVLDGRLYRGAHGAAGEIGYLPLGEGRAARRHRGQFEAGAGSDALLQAARDLGMAGRLSVAQLFAAAREGDPRARRVVDAEGARVADAITAVVSVLDPALVVLGGEIGQETDVLLAPIEARLAELSPLQPPVVASALGDDAVLRGALVTAVDAAQDQIFSEATESPAAVHASTRS